MVPLWMRRDIRRSLESLYEHFRHPIEEVQIAAG